MIDQVHRIMYTIEEAIKKRKKICSALLYGVAQVFNDV